MKRKGLSPLVTLVIIFLMVLILITVLWFFLRPFVNSTEEVGSAQSCFIIQTEPERCLYSERTGDDGNPEWYVTVKAKRGPDALNVTDLRLVFTNSDATPPSASIDWNFRTFGKKLPNPYETTDAGFILKSFLPENIAIAPIVSSNGYVCPASNPLSCSPYYYNGEGCSDVDGSGFVDGNDFDHFVECYDNVSLNLACIDLNEVTAVPARFDITRDGFVNLDDSNAFIEAFKYGDTFECV